MASPRNILFIRHAEAVESNEWPDDDMSRPLTRRGKKNARKLFKLLKKTGLKKITAITSEAVRARQTAKIFTQQTGGKLAASPLLNPGAGAAQIRRVLRQYENEKTIALIGHEPDFSTAISRSIGAPRGAIALEKGTCALVSLDRSSKGTVRWIVPPLPRIGKSTATNFQ